MAELYTDERGVPWEFVWLSRGFIGGGAVPLGTDVSSEMIFFSIGVSL